MRLVDDTSTHPDMPLIGSQEGDEAFDRDTGWRGVGDDVSIRSEGAEEMVRASVVALAVPLVLLAACTSTTQRTAVSGTSSPAPTTAATPTSSSASVTPALKPKPKGRTVLGLVVSQTKLADGYRVILAPATRQTDGQFVAITGRATVTYLIPTSMVPDAGMSLIGPIEIIVDGAKVTGLNIVGG